MHHNRRDVDKIFRTLRERHADVWLTQPSYDTQPRERKPADELPGDVTDYMSAVYALSKLTQGQRLVYKLVVMGLIRAWRNEQWEDVAIEPMSYRQCADYLEVSESSISKFLTRARDNLAGILGDEAQEAE